MLSLKSLGGAGTVTGSKHLLTLGGHRILIDCGLFQGLKNLRDLNWTPLPVSPHDIDAVILTHAHLDHCGYLPRLVREGFRGKVYVTRATRDVAELILMDSGVIYRKNLRRARMDLNEFLMYCRVSGYFDLNQIQTAILEHNGTVTFLPAAMQRPVTPADLSMQPRQELLQTPVVQDGRVLPENLRKAGRDGVWLERKLREKGYHGPEEVLLAMAAGGDQLAVYPMETKKEAREMP